MTAKTEPRAARQRRSRATGETGATGLTRSSGVGLGIAVLWFSVLALIPLIAVVVEASTDGWGGFFATLTDPQTAAALWLTIALITLLNVVLGTAMAWVLVRDQFWGKRIIEVLIDLPFVVRTVQPVLAELDLAVEQAAASLGANRLTILRRIILPALTPAIFAGAAMSFARGVSEFGALILLSGNLPMRTEVASVRILGYIESGNLTADAAVATVLLVGWPVSLVVKFTFTDGLSALTDALTDPDVTFALQLTANVPVQAIILNTVFGVGVSLLLVHKDFPGKRLLSALLDLPLSVSPVVVGLALALTYRADGWFGAGQERTGLRIIFAPPGIVLATAFISLPLVIREVVPVLTEIGTDEEQAARSLGANSLQILGRITLPAIKWAVVYGVVLTLARSLGEFGAVKIVSGNFAGQSQSATLLVEQRYQDFDQTTAYATSFLLAAVSVACIVVVSFLRPDSAVKDKV